MSSSKRNPSLYLIPVLSYKHTKMEFDRRLEQLVKRIINVRVDIVDLNKRVNQ
jgi:hypothetical protein